MEIVSPATLTQQNLSDDVRHEKLHEFRMKEILSSIELLRDNQKEMFFTLKHLRRLEDRDNSIGGARLEDRINEIAKERRERIVRESREKMEKAGVPEYRIKELMDDIDSED